MYLANPCGPAVIDAMRAGVIGFIDTRAQGNKRPGGVTWCADNGCFSDKWDAEKWWAWLVKNAHDADSCLFAVAPDVVGDAFETTRLFRKWGRGIRGLGYPVAYVAQNGIEKLRGHTESGGLTFPVPWSSFEVLFIGGCPECPKHGSFPKPRRTGRGSSQRFYCPTCDIEIFDWKLSPIVQDLIREAKGRGKWVHAGRVNSEKRYEYFRALGCDSADGTYLTRGADTNLPKLLAWTRNNEQTSLFDGGAA